MLKYSRCTINDFSRTSFNEISRYLEKPHWMVVLGLKLDRKKKQPRIDSSSRNERGAWSGHLLWVKSWWIETATSMKTYVTLVPQDFMIRHGRVYLKILAYKRFTLYQATYLRDNIEISSFDVLNRESARLTGSIYCAPLQMNLNKFMNTAA